MLKKTILGTALILGISTVGSIQLAKQSFENVEASESQQQIQKSSLQERLELLELSVIPTTPEEAVQTFGKAVKLRNGALQFAILSDQEKAKGKKKFEESHWVTGVSSPWVKTYEILCEKELKAGTKMEYVVAFDLYTSTGKAGTDQVRLIVEKMNDQWLITKVEAASKDSIGIWKLYEDISIIL